MNTARETELIPWRRRERENVDCMSEVLRAKKTAAWRANQRSPSGLSLLPAVAALLATLGAVSTTSAIFFRTRLIDGQRAAVEFPAT